MFSNLSALGTQVFEGAFVKAPLGRNLQVLVPSAVGGAPTQFQSAPPGGGTIQGRFGWASAADGLVTNTRRAASDQLGVVLPYQARSGADVIGAGWSWQFFDAAVKAWRIRQGLPITLMPVGEFWLKFAGGAFTGEPVYASTVDGSAISGVSSDAELTPWLVCSNANAGDLAAVSTYAKFGA